MFFRVAFGGLLSLWSFCIRYFFIVFSKYTLFQLLCSHCKKYKCGMTLMVLLYLTLLFLTLCSKQQTGGRKKAHGDGEDRHERPWSALLTDVVNLDLRVSRKAYIPIPSPCMFWNFAFALVSVWAGKWKSIFVSCIAGMWFSNWNFQVSEAHRKHKKR